MDMVIFLGPKQEIWLPLAATKVDLSVGRLSLSFFEAGKVDTIAPVSTSSCFPETLSRM